ncbi:MAG: hypothetical protein ACE5H6_02195 [Dehalococcoidia bacterium]
MKKLAILGVVALVLAISLAVAAPVMAGKHGPAGKSNIAHLYLYEKVPSGDWPIVEEGAWGKMKFNLSGPTFDFVFNGHELEENTEYTLIYYPDKTGNPWPRTDIRCLASGSSNEDGDIHLAGSVELGSDLPMAVDINSGAKIWLVESSAVDCETNTMSGWSPTEYLFEHNLITYDDTDAP